MTPKMVFVPWCCTVSKEILTLSNAGVTLSHFRLDEDPLGGFPLLLGQQEG